MTEKPPKYELLCPPRAELPQRGISHRRKFPEQVARPILHRRLDRGVNQYCFQQMNTNETAWGERRRS
jgi:hypothetical protein